MNKNTYFAALIATIVAFLCVLLFAYTSGAPTHTVSRPSFQAPASSTPETPHTPTRSPRESQTSLPAAMPTATSAETKAATIVTETKDSYTIPVTERETALEAMYAYAASGTFTFTGRDYPSLGFFVESIGGKTNANGKYWILYINGTSSSLGASAATVSPSDTLEWRYETSY